MIETDALVAVIGLAVAGIVKGATGLGYTSCALPFLVFAVGLQPAMALVIVPAFATNIGLAVTAGHFIESVRRFFVLYLTMIPGIVLGVHALLWVPHHVATQLLGIVIVSYGMLALMRPGMTIPPAYERPLQAPTGLLNGVLTGLTGAQVMPLFPYVLSLQLDSARTVQVVNIAVLLSTIALGGSLASSGLFTSDQLALSVLGTIPALAGTWLGNGIRRRIPDARFRRYALVTLMLLGILMLLR